MKALNYAEIERRGGRLSGNDDFDVVCCSECGTAYLYNAELLELYLDPENLKACWLNMLGNAQPECRGCKNSDWNFVEVPPEEEARVREGPWAWAL